MPKRGAFAVKPKNGKPGKYPINTAGRARNAIARVQQHGTPAEKRSVFAAVKRRYPGIANRSKVIPTRKGPGRRIGQRPLTKAGGANVSGTVRRRKMRRRGRR